MCCIFLRSFYGEDCCQYHRTGPNPCLKSICKTLKKCPESLRKVVKSNRGDRRSLLAKYRWGVAKCQVCKEYVNIRCHKCYFQPAEKERRRQRPIHCRFRTLSCIHFSHFEFSVSFSFTNSFHTFLSQPVYQVALKARYDRWRREESSSLLRFASTFLLLDCFRQSASGHLYQRESSTLLPTNSRLFSNALKIHFWNTRVRYDLFCTEKHFNLFGRLFFNSFFNLFFNPLLNPNLEP